MKWKHKSGIAKRRGKEIRQREHKKYMQVTLQFDQTRQTKFVHQLVALAFVENPLGLPEVDHKDTNRMNNAAANLEWVTQEENRRRAQKTGLLKVGEQAVGAKLTADKVREIRMLSNEKTYDELSRLYGVGIGRIGQIARGEAWRHLQS